MVEIKVDSREIIFRVIYAGRDAATKFATVRSVHELLPDEDIEPITVMHAGGDRIVGFTYRPDDVTPLFGMKVGFHALAIPGTMKSSANETLLMRAADSVVFVDDRDPVVGDEGAPEHFAHLLESLEAQGRGSDKMPVTVQCYEDAVEDRGALYRNLAKGRKFGVSTVGEDRHAVANVFREMRLKLLGDFRGYEKQLEKRGLTDHVKIRDRVYEKVAVPKGFDDGRDASKPMADIEMRLIKSLDTETVDESSRRFTRWGIWFLLAATIASAFAVSLMF